MRAIPLCFAGLLGAAVVAQAADAPPAGEKWQVTANVEAMGMKLPGQTSTVCTSPNSDAPPIGKQEGCESYDVHRSGNTVSFKMRCTGRNKMEGSGSITYAGDTYRGSMQASADGHSMDMTWDGRKLGPCDGSEANVKAEKMGKQIEQQIAANTQQACASMARDGTMPYLFLPGPSGTCKDDAAGKARFCASFKSYSAYAQNARSEAGGGLPGGGMDKPLTDGATLCKTTAEQVRKDLCSHAEADHKLEFIEAHCPVEKAAIVQRECAGRDYSTVDGEFRGLCAGAYADSEGPGGNARGKANDAPEAKPDAKDKVEDKLKKGKDKLKGLLGF